MMVQKFTIYFHFEIQCMERFSKRFSLQQLVYRSVTFDDGISIEHNAAIRVKLVGALLESEVGQVNQQGVHSESQGN